MTKPRRPVTVPVPKFLAPLLKTEIGDRDANALLFPAPAGTAG